MTCSPTSTSAPSSSSTPSTTALVTIGLAHVENPLEFGIVITDDDGRIERFLEKPTWGQVFSDTINTGIYVLEPEIFDYIAPDQPVDFSSDVFPELLEDGQALHGSIAEGYWEDVGTLEAYVQAHKDVLDGKVQVDIARLRDVAGRVGGRGGRDRPRGHRDGARRSSATTAGSRPAPASASTRCWAPTCASATTPSSIGPWSTTTSTWARPCACGVRWWGGPATCARGCEPRRAW